MAQQDIQIGDSAADFSTQASLNGKEFNFSLKEALAQGPVVLYFYPSAFTPGCDLQAHTFSELSGDFKNAGASIMGLSADDINRLHEFSSDPDFCAGNFPVGADESGEIAAKYGLAISQSRAGAKDSRGQEIDHGFIPRVTYVIDKNSEIVAVFSSEKDGISPDEHVYKALEVVKEL